MGSAHAETPCTPFRDQTRGRQRTGSASTGVPNAQIKASRAEPFPIFSSITVDGGDVNSASSRSSTSRTARLHHPGLTHHLHLTHFISSYLISSHLTSPTVRAPPRTLETNPAAPALRAGPVRRDRAPSSSRASHLPLVGPFAKPAVLRRAGPGALGGRPRPPGEGAPASDPRRPALSLPVGQPLLLGDTGQLPGLRPGSSRHVHLPPDDLRLPALLHGPAALHTHPAGHRHLRHQRLQGGDVCENSASE
jgi:hypothetical protein